MPFHNTSKLVFIFYFSEKEGNKMFSKSKRVVGVLLAVLMLAAVFAGCDGSTGGTSSAGDSGTSSGGSATQIESVTVDEMMADAQIAMGDEDNVTLKVWCPQDALEVFKKQCDAFVENFKEQGRTITIEVNPQGESDAQAQVRTDPDAAADVFGFASDQGLALFKDEYLLKVNLRYVEPIQETHMEEAVETAMFQSASDDQAYLYAYPEEGANSYALFYDKRILSEDDVKTLEGIMEVCNAEQKNFLMEMGDGYYGCVIPFTGGGTLDLEDDLETQILNYDYAQIGPVAQAFSDLCATSQFFKNESVNSTIVSGFKNGTHAAGVVGAWKIADIEGALGENMGVAKLPTINVNGEDKQMISIYGYKYLGVNAKTDFPLTAQSLAYYLSGEECQRQRTEELRWGPSITSLIESDLVQNDVALKALYDQQAYSLPQKNIVTGFWTPTGTYAAYVVDSTKEHDEATMQQQYDDMVEVIEMG